MTWNLGVVGADPVNGVGFQLTNLQVTGRSDVDDAGNVVYQVESNATGNVGPVIPNSEFVLLGQ